MIDQQAEDRSGIAAAIAGAAEALTFAEIDELALPPLAGAVGARETLFWNRDPAGEARVRGGTLGWYLPTFIGSFEEHDPIAAAHRRFAGPTIRSCPRRRLRAVPPHRAVRQLLRAGGRGAHHDLPHRR